MIIGYLKYVLVWFAAVLLVACSGGGDGAGSDSGTAALIWTAPSLREDNTALSLSDIAGYRVYYGGEKGVYPNRIDINDGSATQLKLSSLPSGKYYAVMTTIDFDGLESGYSLEVEVETTNE